MKINDQTSAAVQAAPSENREIFMNLLRDSLRATAGRMLEEEVNALYGSQTGSGRNGLVPFGSGRGLLIFPQQKTFLAES
jgi:hypothetical protein